MGRVLSPSPSDKRGSGGVEELKVDQTEARLGAQGRHVPPFLLESVRRTWIISRMRRTLHPVPHSTPCPSFPRTVVRITCTLQMSTGRHEGVQWSHQPRATSQEVVELARFSLAAVRVPATRAQLFPHDKLLQHLIRHLRSQYSPCCTSLWMPPPPAQVPSSGVGRPPGPPAT